MKKNLNLATVLPVNGCTFLGNKFYIDPNCKYLIQIVYIII